MAENYYPQLKEFLERLRTGEPLNEAEMGRIPKLEDMEDAVSPYTGNKKNVKIYN